MAGQYQEFLSAIYEYGVAKTSHFRLSIPINLRVPSGESFSDLDRLLGLRCEATELPGRQLISNESRTYGPTYKTPYQSVYQEATFNFLETDTFLIRHFFETWMSSVFDPATNLLSYPQSYRFDINLKQYDVTDGSRPHSVKEPETPTASLEAIAVWEMFNAFPTAVNQMPVAWAEDGLHRTTVTMAFEWYSLTTGPGSSNRSARRPEIKSPTIAPKGSSGGILGGIFGPIKF